MGHTMDDGIDPPIRTHVFIVRLWCEPREIAHAQGLWRGSVEKMPGGERRCFDRLARLLAHVASLCIEAGATGKPFVNRLLRLCLWLERRATKIC